MCASDGTCKPPDQDLCLSVQCNALDECHDIGSCQAGLCTDPPKADGSPCSIGECQLGVCIDPNNPTGEDDSCDNIQCTASDECHLVGTCFGGICTDPPKEDGSTCSNGTCQNGICVPATDEDPCKNMVCTAPSECFQEGMCSNGACSDVKKPDGTTCSTGTCQDGQCDVDDTDTDNGGGGIFGMLYQMLASLFDFLFGWIFDLFG